MCGNRVEELETRVQELEASVEGLTDELVECKVRIRELESAVDEDLGFVPTGTEDETAKSSPKSTSVGAEMVDADAEAAAESGDSAEATKSEDTESGDKSEESESDIIVA